MWTICRNSGQRSFVYFFHIVCSVCVSRIPRHCLHTSLTFHSVKSSRYEKMDRSTSTGSPQILFSALKSTHGRDSRSKHWSMFRGANGAVGCAKSKLTLLRAGGIISCSFSLRSSAGTSANSSCSSSRSWPARSAALYGGSSLPESSSSDRSAVYCSSLRSFGGPAKRNEWHVPQSGSPKLGP